MEGGSKGCELFPDQKEWTQNISTSHHLAKKLGGADLSAFGCHKEGASPALLPGA